MRLGTFVPFSQRRFVTIPERTTGRLIAHEELATHLLRHRVVSAVHVFSQSTRSVAVARERRECEAAIEDAFAADDIRPSFKSLSELPAALTAGDYAFLSAGSESHRLGQLRWRVSVPAFPVTTLIHGVNWFDMMASYLALLATSMPCDALVATSDAAERAVRAILEWLRASCGVTPNVNIVRIPLGVDVDRVWKTSQILDRQLLGIDESELVVLYMGRLTDEFKADLEPLLGVIDRLSRRHPKIRLLLAGQHREGDSHSPRLRAVAKARGLGSRLTVIENPPEAVKHAIYGASDVFVSPADNVQESFGLTLLEAMACGLPVVAADWSGYRDIVVDGETGFLVPTYWDPRAGQVASNVNPADLTAGTHHYLARHTVIDVDALYQRLDELLGCRELRITFGAAGRRRAEERYAWRHICTRYRELFESQMASIRGGEPGRRPMLSLNDVFSHYATTVLDDTMVVRRTESGDAMMRGTLASGADQSVEGADVLLLHAAEHGVSLGEMPLAPNGGWDLLVALLKAGHLQLEPS